MSPQSLFFVGTWLFSLLASSLHYTSLWQVKEYRVDRFVDQMRTPGGWKSFFTAWWMVLGLLLVMSWFMGSADSWLFLALAVYAGRAVIIGHQVYTRKLKRPKLTKKAILILLIIFDICLIFPFLAYFQNQTHFQTMCSAVLMEWLLPGISGLVVLAFKPLTVLLKRRILRKARVYMQSRPDLIVIGITGSYGKTSTKEFLKTILETRYRVLATPERVNSEIGVAQWILRGIDPKTEVLIVEMGAYKMGEIQAICEIVSPQIGIVTGINEQHLSLFGNIQNTVSAKGELIRSLPKDGLAILNGDNTYCLKMKEFSRAPVQTYSLEQESAAVFASDVQQERQQLLFQLHTQGEVVACQAALLGRHQVANILAVSACALRLNFSPVEIAAAIQKLSAFTRTMQPVELPGRVLGIDDSYNANPDGVYTALAYLQEVSAPSKILIITHLHELGKSVHEVHAEIGRRAGGICDLIIMADESYADDMRGGALGTGISESQFVMEKNPEPILKIIKNTCQEDTIILFEGRGTEKILQLLKKS